MSHARTGSHHSTTEEEEPSEDMASSIRPLSSFPRPSPAQSEAPSLAPAPPSAPVRRTARISVPSPVRISWGAPPRDPSGGRTYRLPGDPYAAGPSRVSDLYSFEHLINRERASRAEAVPSRAPTCVPVEHGTEWTLEDRRRFRALAVDAQYDRASMAQFESTQLSIITAVGRLISRTFRNSEDSQAAIKIASLALGLSCFVMTAMFVFMVYFFYPVV